MDLRVVQFSEENQFAIKRIHAKNLLLYFEFLTTYISLNSLKFFGKAHFFGQSIPKFKDDVFNALKNTTFNGQLTVQYFGLTLWNTPIFIRATNTVALLQSEQEAYFIHSYVISPFSFFST